MQRTKKVQQSQGSAKFMKSKYLDNKKQTHTLHVNKVMLTDLCPEEKAKIGELIKTLQQRKNENQDLQQQLNSWKSNYIALDKIKTQIQNLIEAKNWEIKRLTSELNQISQQKIDKQVELHEVRMELQKILKKTNLQSSKQNYGTNTHQIQTSSQQTQTKEKKKKLKDREIQVNTIEQIGGFEQRQIRKNNFYQPNSKSFDKIMKGETLLSSSENKHYQTAAFRDDDNFDEGEVSLGNSKSIVKPQKSQTSNIENFYGKKELKASQLQYNEKNWSEYCDQNQIQNQKSSNEQIQVEDTENDDDEFQMLAKKWLQLKEKNIQQLTQGYLNNEMEDPALNINLKSLGIQSKLKNPSSKHKGRQNEQQEGDVDEDELNRALKSKDFSASRLLNNSKSKRNIEDPSEKKSLQNSGSSYRNTTNLRVKNQTKTESVMNQRQNLPKKGSFGGQENGMRSKYSQDQSSRGVDFYSAELMDLVEEINK